MSNKSIRTSLSNIEHVDPDCHCSGKKCSKCKEPLCILHFGIDNRLKSGLRSVCTPCRRLEYKETYPQQKEHANTLRRDKRVADPEHRAKLQRENQIYHHTHKDEYNARKRKYAQEHPDRELARRHLRLQREQAAPGTFPDEEWEDMKAFYHYQCLRCRKTGTRLYPDHIVPLSLGGSHDASNRQPLCNSCNSTKGTKSTDYRPNFFSDGSVGA